ncbi:MAG: hypothetical protein A2Z96_04165 [Spirochaetes bacterium GWB1_48_6]|nr:MAG: hypothetical protein A2Z96_04165 [Spirochaetes bacterium GWB1_48_6]
MELNEYQTRALGTAVYKNWDQQLVCTTLGLSGEAGEVAEKVKKLIRDQDSVVTEEFKEGVKKELGDVLWYLSTLSHTLGFTLEEVANLNLEKLASRKTRGVLHGNGDHR